jgi:2'-5' RNA ligase
VSGHYFIAVPLSNDLKKELFHLSKGWRGKLPFKKWTDEEDYHITLAFLGPVEEDKRNEIVEEIQQSLLSIDPFTLQLSALGHFGPSKTPSVWWAGVEKSNELEELQKNVALSCEKVGFQLEKRPYKPHITLAKRFDLAFKDDFTIPSTCDTKNKTIDVTSIVLYQIHPKSTPSYQIVEKWNLKGKQ